MRIKKSLQGQITVHLVQQSVSKNSSRKHCVGRATGHVRGLLPSQGLGTFASGPVNPLLNLQ